MEISERLIRSLEAPQKGNVIHYDSEIGGFGVRITAAGAIAFVLTYWIGNRQRRITIGRYPDWSVRAAREKAKDLRHQVEHGKDPLAERQATRGEPLVSDLARDFMEGHALAKKRPSSIRNDRQMLDTIILPRLGKLRVSSVGRRDIERLHSSLRKTPYRANRVLALLSTMFTFAVEWKWRTDNPTRGIPRYKEHERKTWLSLEQLRQLQQALAEFSNQEAADAIQLLIVTGAREMEVLKATWDQFDLRRGVWTKPSHATKERETEHVPLNRAALSILSGMNKRRNGNVYLFPGKADGPRATIRRPWVQVLKACGLTEAVEKPGKRKAILIEHKPRVRIHDLRHSFASHLVSNGASLYLVGRLLGHTRPETTQRYSHVDLKSLQETSNVFGKVYRLRD